MPNALFRIWIVALVLVIASLSATAALAHAQLLSSSPAPDAVVERAPPMAQLTFNEPVTALVVTLIAPDGSRTDLLGGTTSGDAVTVTLPEGLGPGTYVLSWRVVSVDAHPIGGSLLFSVGSAGGHGAHMAENADQLVPGALWLSKLGLLAGLLFGIGGAVFNLVTPLPLAARRVALALTGIGLVAAPLSLGLHGLDALGRGLQDIVAPEPWLAGAATSYGMTVLMAAAALALGLLALAGRFHALGWLAWPLAAAALSLSGHAGAAEPQWLTRPMVFLHLSGLIFWVGALVPLAVQLRDRTPAADQALADFSSIIPLAVAPVVISGVTLALVQMGAPGPQWLTAYGFILAGKLTLLIGLFTLALWNRLRLTRPVLAGEPRARQRLGLSVRGEIVLVLLILGLVAAWRFTPPPRALAEVVAVTATEPLLLHLMEGEDMAMVTLDPGRSGSVTLDIALADLTGAPVAATAITGTVSSPALGIEPYRFEAVEIGGAWQVKGLELPLPGRWQLELEVRKSRFSQVRLMAEFALP